MEMSSHSTSLSRNVRFSYDLIRSDDGGKTPIHISNILQLTPFAQWTIELPDSEEFHCSGWTGNIHCNDEGFIWRRPARRSRA